MPQTFASLTIRESCSVRCGSCANVERSPAWRQRSGCTRRGPAHGVLALRRHEARRGRGRGLGLDTWVRRSSDKGFRRPVHRVAAVVPAGAPALAPALRWWAGVLLSVRFRCTRLGQPRAAPIVARVRAGVGCLTVRARGRCPAPRVGWAVSQSTVPGVLAAGAHRWPAARRATYLMERVPGRRGTGWAAVRGMHSPRRLPCVGAGGIANRTHDAVRLQDEQAARLHCPSVRSARITVTTMPLHRTMVPASRNTAMGTDPAVSASAV